MSDEFALYRSICHIFCGEECGNGYLVAPDLVLTADHVVRSFFEDGTKVDICFEREECVACEVLSKQDDPSMPLTILRLASARDCGTFKVDLEYVKPIDPPMYDCNAREPLIKGPSNAICNRNWG